MKDFIDSITTGPLGEGEEIQEGDCVASISGRSRVPWPRLWQGTPENGELRTARKHPNLLLAGDKITIPEPEAKEDEEEEIDTQQTYQLKPAPRWHLKLRFTLFGQPRKDTPYVLFVWKGSKTRPEPVATGQLDQDGVLIFKEMEADWNKVKVALGSGVAAESEYEFQVGDVAPPTEPRGIQTRLWNLGYLHGELSDKFTDETENALRRFMVKNGLLAKCDDDVDDDAAKEALALLVKTHGC